MLETGLRKINGRLFYVQKVREDTYVLEEVDEIVHSEESKYQKIDVVREKHYGLCLFLDGSMQITEGDEHIYHEAFVHPAMITHPNPEKVLIVGGGDGGVLREVLKHNTVKKAVLVEIDERVIEVVKKYMPSVPQGSFSDPRAEIVIEDGFKYIEKPRNEFDIAYIDLTDSPDSPIYGEEFVKKLKNALRKKSVVVFQTFGLVEHLGSQQKIVSELKKYFKYVGIYGAFVPSFMDLWTFTYASDYFDLKNVEEDYVRKTLDERSVKTRFYSPETHRMLFINAEYSRVADRLKKL